MSYLVLARTWRPKSFEDVVGQQPIVQTLQNAIRNNRVAHAFLFTGPRGVGKTSVARILAKALNCVHGPTPTPCNQCDACQEITKGIAPDVFEIDGASNTGVDHVRDLQETVKYLPQKSRYKIYIVDEVHMLSTPAFNAFLKTLEEPPAHVIFIFATTEPHKIIETVIDRCQRYDFKKIPSSLIFQKLNEIVQKEGITISPNALQIIAREAEGSLRDAQSLLDQVITYAGEEVKDSDVADILGVVETKILFDIAAAVLHGDLKHCLELIENVFTYGTDVRQFYQGLMEHFRNLMVARISNNAHLFPDLSQKEIEELANQSREFSLERMQLILKILIESEEYIYSAPLPRIILEAVLLRLATTPSSSSLREILDKLAQLQERLSGDRSISTRQTTPSTGIGSEESDKMSEESTPSPKKETPEPAFSQYTDEKVSPASTHEGQQSLEDVWDGLLTFTRTRKPPLASLLAHGKLLQETQDAIEIGFPKNFIFLERIQDPQKKEELSQICEEFFRKKIKVSIQVLLSPAKSPDDKDQGLSIAQKNDLIRKEAKSNPLVKEALTIFGGSISEIKIMNNNK